MWFLTSEVDSRVIYVLANKDITIGRKTDSQVCEFAITDDPSISRKHATLSVSDDCLYVQDLGSRYGTYVNNTEDKLDSTSKVKLQKNDVVRFGKMGSIWKVNNVNFVTCTSTLKGENLQNLKVCLEKCGGILKNEWDDTCAYLTMPAITLTIKVVLALADGSHIVTTEFWQKCLDAITNNLALPDPANFTPKVIESTLNKENVSFHPNTVRKTLFAGKTIVFFGKRQLETYKTILMKCSASPVLLSETRMTKSSLCETNAIVIQYNTSQINQETQAQKNQINDIVSYIKGKAKRVVAEAEIGLAILYCSTSKYCNPDFNFSTEIIKQAPNTVQKPANVLATESQEPAKNKKENVVINETLNSTCNTNEAGESSKRKLTEGDDLTSGHAQKKFAKSNDNKSNDESLKRKLTEDSNDSSNPSKKMAVDDENDLFNFTSKTNNAVEPAGKKLNFSVPQKRNLETANNDEEELFNFTEDKSKSGKDEANTMFDSKTVNNIKVEPEIQTFKRPKIDYDINVDLATLRGSKLKELETLNNGESVNTNILKIKQENMDDIDTKMQNLELGTTVITIRKDLIKREPMNNTSEFSDVISNTVKNFKKFKKVWPVKRQGNIIKSASVVIPDSLNMQEGLSQAY